MDFGESDKNRETASESKEEELLFVSAPPLPRHSYVDVQAAKGPKKNVQGAINLQRLAVLMDSALLSTEAIHRAQRWAPRAGDVIIAASPHCGHSVVSTMVRYLCARDDMERTAITRDEDATPPWIDCSLVDNDPEILARDQPGTNRVFRTTLAHSMLSTTIDKNPQTKFIYVCRHPVHVRAVYYQQLKKFYIQYQLDLNPGGTELEFAVKFEQSFSPDDVVNIPLLVAQTTFHSDKQYLESEYNTRDWFLATLEKSNCLIVMYEEILCAPEKLLKRIAKFIGREQEESRYEEILPHVTGSNLGEFSRRNSAFFSADQETFVDTHLERLDEGATVFEERRDYAASEDIRASTMSGRSDLSSVIDEGMFPCELSAKAQLVIRTRWTDVFLSKHPMYEDFYETVVGQKYPVSKQSPKKKRPTSRLSRWGSSNEGRTSTRQSRLSTAMGKLFGSSMDE
jgi:hypothetical protein